MLYKVIILWLLFLLVSAFCFITGRAHGVGVGNLVYLPTLFSFLIQYGNNYTVCKQPNSYSEHVVKHMVGPRSALDCCYHVCAGHVQVIAPGFLLAPFFLGWGEGGPSNLWLSPSFLLQVNTVPL